MTQIMVDVMHVPESCRDCFMKYRDFFWFCGPLSTDMSNVDIDNKGEPFDFRPEWCPIHVLQEHGRLIDADKLKTMVDDSILFTSGFKKTFDDLLDGEPTVIPANGKEDEVED